MNNIHHQEILNLIRASSGKGTQHTFLDAYLGNYHPRYAITAPVLRSIAKAWMKEHRDLSVTAFAGLLTSLIAGESSTEKVVAGILMDYATKDQWKFNPALFDKWLNHLVGWVEVDTVCTGSYTKREIPGNLKAWKSLLTKFSKSKNIQKRRASVVLLCSPLSQQHHEELADIALKNIDRLKAEKEILITRAISWVLRSMIKHHRTQVVEYLKNNMDTLPKIAIRETQVKLKTGKKTKSKI